MGRRPGDPGLRAHALADPDCLDTLAAANAEVGDYVSAIKWQTQAIKLVRQNVRSLLRQRATAPAAAGESISKIAGLLQEQENQPANDEDFSTLYPEGNDHQHLQTPLDLQAHALPLAKTSALVPVLGPRLLEQQEPPIAGPGGNERGPCPSPDCACR